MILRSITRHVRDQNWFAVGIDFVIVIVGVFIGIQVSNWNEARADGRLGREYQSRLVAELQQDYATFQTLHSYYGAVLRSIEDTDRLLASDDPDPIALVAAAYRASEYNNNPSNRATWDEIISAGHIGLLHDEAVESALSNYYRFQGVTEANNAKLADSPYRLAVRSLIPLPVQLAIRKGCSDVVDQIQTAQRFADECSLNVDTDLLSETRDTLYASTQIRETLRYQYSMVASVQINNTGNLILLMRVLGDLGAEPAPQAGSDQ